MKSALAENTIKVTEELFGPAGIFEQIDLREAAQIRGDAGLEEQRALTDSLVEISRTLTEEVQQEFIAASQKANRLIEERRLYTNGLAAVAGALLIGVVLVVVERQFNSRISKLTTRVLAIAKGQKDPGAADTINDELGAMGAALEVFKRNSAELRAANDTLARRNTIIQQLGTRLETVLDTASSGIIAFDVHGRIVLANRPARHFLGGISDQTPFDRPQEVRFLEREDLSLLDASSDPINRVIAGQILNHEIALMERIGQPDGRYVRLTSNRVGDPDLECAHGSGH